ncbi:MAG: TRAP transporter small permease subunit [Rhodospirillaceae bacterium]|jgi:TRAP-type mannitol/chloroaromatic compound transport system permease small subunit|nr:TRAP transporter small permease subunit [Rhodospirillaceae bacterium]MBT4587912.1 TRAP transporter small permease subunit [Rhodospirillaceae bacterium]MBT5940746.1 TRAP transporter small permease subunit [Rhodospirillaceae bacterium]MBT7266521.1 TRAP transporter small permease subunit [Rhodospirillaceae bacterium]
MQNSSLPVYLRIAALSMAALSVVYVANNFLIFWLDWPGTNILFADLGWFGLEPLRNPLAGNLPLLGWLQVLFYVGAVALIAFFVTRSQERTLIKDSEFLDAIVKFIIRSAFWAVLFIGIVDMAISFLRVEGLLVQTVGEEFAKELGRSAYRGAYIHFPLLLLSFVIGYFTRTLGFIWLALLIVIAELMIVITRFIFSYEQAFMGDLVRFWYAALFLFASAYTLIEEGHVRVDILYTGFSERGKAWSNVIGTLLLGLPLCWIILTRGLWDKSNLINAPLLTFEISQSGYGLYVKYLMAGFLLVYALSMMIQFASYFLSNAAILIREPGAHSHDEHLVL